MTELVFTEGSNRMMYAAEQVWKFSNHTSVTGDPLLIMIKHRNHVGEGLVTAYYKDVISRVDTDTHNVSLNYIGYGERVERYVVITPLKLKQNYTIDERDLIVECVDDRTGMKAGISNKIRVTHVPTGTVAECNTGRSQHKNRAIAIEMIEWALSYR